MTDTTAFNVDKVIRQLREHLEVTDSFQDAVWKTAMDCGIPSVAVVEAVVAHLKDRA